MSNKLNFKFDRDFTVVPNIILRDRRLSYKAKGLFLQIISVPETWNFSVRGLAALAKDSTRSITSGLRELEECGYLEWTKQRTAFNKFAVEVNVLLPEPFAVSPQDKTPYGKTANNKELIDKSIQQRENFSTSYPQVGENLFWADEQGKTWDFDDNGDPQEFKK